MRILRKVDHMAVPGWVAAVSQDDAGGHHLVDGRSGVLRYVLLSPGSIPISLLA